MPSLDCSGDGGIGSGVEIICDPLERGCARTQGAQIGTPAQTSGKEFQKGLSFHIWPSQSFPCSRMASRVLEGMLVAFFCLSMPVHSPVPKTQ